MASYYFQDCEDITRARRRLAGARAWSQATSARYRCGKASLITTIADRRHLHRRLEAAIVTALGAPTARRSFRYLFLASLRRRRLTGIHLERST